MPLHNGVGVNSKKDLTSDIMLQVHSIWAKGCMLDIFAIII